MTTGLTRGALLLLGLAGYGFSMALMVQAGLGLDPWDVFHQGLSRHTGMTIGVASAVVGGTVLAGGTGSVVGGMLGILLINMLRSGVVLLGLPSDNFEAIVGITIVAAAILNEKIRTRG